MSLREVLDQIAEFTPAKRIQSVEAALDGVESMAASPDAEASPTQNQLATIATPNALPPMSYETYEAYQEGFRGTSTIDWDAWK